MKRVILRSLILLFYCFSIVYVTSAQSPAFTVVPLGVKGGLDESNLSAYMAAAAGTNDYICLDAGTLYSGIRAAVENGVFPPPVGAVLRRYIKGYFISHPHLDHVAGLIINSPDDSAKNIYGLPSCLNVIRDKYFSWQSWANFADDGEKPLLKKYHYVPMQPGREMAIENTALHVQAWPLSHGAPYESAAFLVRSGAGGAAGRGDNYLLYLGDTGADSVEQSDRLHALWLATGPLVKNGRLKAIFIEVSFPNEQPDKQLFGHLTPRLLMQELKALEQLAGEGTLKGLPVVITHRKPSGNQEETIAKQLKDNNPLQVKLVFPEQGKRLDL
jgi:3',5'-cyclic-nucleotide phosphodiesterase